MDAAETFRVRAYIPEGNDDAAIIMTLKDLRPGKEGVKRSKDGRVNVSHFEDKDANVLVILWSPVAYPTLESLTINR